MKFAHSVFLVSWLVAALLAACSLEERDEVSTASAPILGGTPGTVGQFPTTVGIFNGGLCTGTLVDSDLVLTAAHCITPALLGFSSQAEVTANTTVILDATNLLSGGGQQVAAADTIPHPGFSFQSLGDDDIGLIRLSTPITDRTPTPINRIATDAPIGIRLLQVGYGMTEAGNQSSAGTLYYVEDKPTISCAPYGGSDSELLCFSQTDGTGKCSGDSGGPSYATIGGVQRVVGVTSFGDQSCAQFGADTRVDAETAFLFDHAPELQCQADGACNDVCGGGLPVDPDCPTCTGDADCEDDEVCNSNGFCEPEPFSPGGLGSACTSNEDCFSRLCGMTVDGGQCTDPCDGSDGSCPDGFDCVEASGDDQVCWPGSGGGGCSAGGSDAPVACVLLLLGFVFLRSRRPAESPRSRRRARRGGRAW